jgi:hypothetical protein
MLDDDAVAYAEAVADTRLAREAELLESAIDAMAQAKLDVSITKDENAASTKAEHSLADYTFAAWPRLEGNRMSIEPEKRMVSAWLGSKSTVDAVLHYLPPPPIGGYGKPSITLGRGGICKNRITKPRTAVSSWKRLQDAGASRVAHVSARPMSSSAALKSLRGLKAGLAVQERAVAASKLRGATRRRIGKHSKHEVFERARRSAPLVVCGEAEAAARRSRHALQDERLADMLEDGLSMRPPTARQLCAGGGRGPDCIDWCEL